MGLLTDGPILRKPRYIDIGRRLTGERVGSSLNIEGPPSDDPQISKNYICSHFWPIYEKLVEFYPCAYSTYYQVCSIYRKELV